MLGRRRPRRISVVVAFFSAALLGAATPASAVPAFEFETPLFGLSSRGDILFVADSGQGVVRLGAETGRVVAELPGVVDVEPLANRRMWALTSGPKHKKLWMVVRGTPRLIANLGAFERTENPHEAHVDSNPFDVEVLGGGQVLVADAAANALLNVDRQGNIHVVATFPDEEVSTANAKQLVGCPNADPEFEEICALPAMVPTEAVSTSVAVGPDGAYYVGELKGFPAPTGESQVWRVEAGTTNADCATSEACSVVADGFTSIVDLHFAADGTLYVVELDEDSFFAVELEHGAGGTVNACNSTNWNCTQAATNLQIPIAVTTTASGGLFAAVGALIPGAAEIIEIT